MGANLYAILILAPLFVTGLLVAWFGGIPKKGDRAVRVCVGIIGLLFSVVIPPFYSASPVLPLAAGFAMLCIPVCTVFIKRPWIAAFASGLFFVQTFFATSLYTAAMLAPGTTEASPHYVAHCESRNLKYLANMVAACADHPQRDYPSGYLEDMNDEGIQSALGVQLQRRDDVTDYRITPYWHTQMTGLRHMQVRDTKIGFDSGRLDNLGAYHVRGFGRFRDGRTVHPIRL